MKRINGLMFLCCAVFLFSILCRAEELKFTVNDKPVLQGDTLRLSKDSLVANKIIFAVSAPEGAVSAEISLDNGRMWEAMKKDAERFVYEHRPIDDQDMRLVFMFKDAKGGASMREADAVVIYMRNTPQEAVILVLEKMKAAYEAELLGRFMDLFSARFPNRVKFEESIQNDFYSYNNIRLFYRIDRMAFDEDYQGAVWNVYWERKYMDRSGVNFSDSANITIRFDKEGNAWYISGFNGNTMFGSSLTSPAELYITSADINASNVGGYVVDIFTVVHNTGGINANNITVNTYKKRLAAGPDPDYVLIDTQVINIPAGTQASTAKYTYTGAVAPLGGLYEFKVIVDPDNTLGEANVANNTATTTLNIVP